MKNHIKKQPLTTTPNNNKKKSTRKTRARTTTQKMRDDNNTLTTATGWKEKTRSRDIWVRTNGVEGKRGRIMLEGEDEKREW